MGGEDATREQHVRPHRGQHQPRHEEVHGDLAEGEAAEHVLPAVRHAGSARRRHRALEQLLTARVPGEQQGARAQPTGGRRHLRRRHDGGCRGGIGCRGSGVHGGQRGRHQPGAGQPGLVRRHARGYRVGAGCLRRARLRACGGVVRAPGSRDHQAGCAHAAQPEGGGTEVGGEGRDAPTTRGRCRALERHVPRHEAAAVPREQGG